MAINQEQLQADLSVHDFLWQYGTEEQGESALVAARCPKGWRCARCSYTRALRTQSRLGHPLWECFVYGYQSLSTYHSFDHAKYAARYLAEFAYRFNRRVDLARMLPRLLHTAVTTEPQPLRTLR